MRYLRIFAALQMIHDYDALRNKEIERKMVPWFVWLMVFWGSAALNRDGQFWAQTRPKLRGADAFLPVLWNRYVVEEIATI